MQLSRHISSHLLLSKKSTSPSKNTPCQVPHAACSSGLLISLRLSPTVPILSLSQNLEEEKKIGRFQPVFDGVTESGPFCIDGLWRSVIPSSVSDPHLPPYLSTPTTHRKCLCTQLPSLVQRAFLLRWSPWDLKAQT